MPKTTDHPGLAMGFQPNPPQRADKRQSVVGSSVAADHRSKTAAEAEAQWAAENADAIEEYNQRIATRGLFNQGMRRL